MTTEYHPPNVSLESVLQADIGKLIVSLLSEVHHLKHRVSVLERDAAEANPDAGPEIVEQLEASRGKPRSEYVTAEEWEPSSW